jgi:hypothetical protein
MPKLQLLLGQTPAAGIPLAKPAAPVVKLFAAFVAATTSALLIFLLFVDKIRLTDLGMIYLLWNVSTWTFFGKPGVVYLLHGLQPSFFYETRTLCFYSSETEGVRL